MVNSPTSPWRWFLKGLCAAALVFPVVALFKSSSSHSARITHWQEPVRYGTACLCLSGVLGFDVCVNLIRPISVWHVWSCFVFFRGKSRLVGQPGSWILAVYLSRTKDILQSLFCSPWSSLPVALHMSQFVVWLRCLINRVWAFLPLISLLKLVIYLAAGTCQTAHLVFHKLITCWTPHMNFFAWVTRIWL